MATHITNDFIANTNDTQFRAWSTEVYDMFIAAGLTQTSDTGQLTTPVTASRPAAAVQAGYWIFRFNDTAHATAPIFLKVEPGSASIQTRPSCRVTIGTGSNGSGTITGIVAGPGESFTSANVVAGSPFPSYINYDTATGMLGFTFKSGGASGGGTGGFFLCRTMDITGAPTTDGFFFTFLGNSGATPRTHSGLWGSTVYTSSQANTSCLAPMSQTGSLVGADPQAFKVYGVFPDVRVVPQLICTFLTEHPASTIASDVEVIDGVPHDYISPGSVSNNMHSGGSAAAALCMCMIWD